MKTQEEKYSEYRSKVVIVVRELEDNFHIDNGMTLGQLKELISKWEAEAKLKDGEVISVCASPQDYDGMDVMMSAFVERLETDEEFNEQYEKWLAEKVAYEERTKASFEKMKKAQEKKAERLKRKLETGEPLTTFEKIVVSRQKA
jgi:chlorite dismutase